MGAMNELWDYHKQAIALARELEALKKSWILIVFLVSPFMLYLGETLYTV